MLTYRNELGRPLTADEVDNNFRTLSQARNSYLRVIDASALSGPCETIVFSIPYEFVGAFFSEFSISVKSRIVINPLFSISEDYFGEISDSFPIGFTMFDDGLSFIFSHDDVSDILSCSVSFDAEIFKKFDINVSFYDYHAPFDDSFDKVVSLLNLST